MDTLLPAVFAALADPTRLRLLQAMAEAPADSPLCVCALTYRAGVTQPAVSQHLRVLRGLGLVRGERCGLRVHYRLDRPRLRELQSNVHAFLESLATEHERPRGSPPCKSRNAPDTAAAQVRHSESTEKRT